MHQPSTALPIHPSKRHPLTGQPLQALWVSPSGRVCWPLIGAAPEGEGGGAGGGAGAGSGAGGAGAGAGAGGAGNGTGAGAGDGAGAGGAGAGAGAGAGTGAGANAVDAQGNDLGYPKDTPWTDMTDKQATAYWRHQSKRHEGRVRDLVGERKPEEIKADLEAYAKIQREQQTPAEQALTDAREQGKKEGAASERTNTATAIFRGALEAGGLTGEDLEEMVANFNVASYITDDGVDTTKITNFAKRFTPGKGQQGNERRRDFGGGQRREGAPERGAAGKAMAEKRFGKKTTA